MTFPNTELESQRVLAAASANMKLESRNNADLAVVILLSCVYGINFFAALFVLANRKYPPLKSKGPLIMVAMFISSAFWLVGDLQINGHVTLVGSVLQHCRGFGFWARILVGACTITGLIAIRSYIYYRIFNQNLPARGWRFFLPIGIYFLCLVVVGIVISVLDSSKSVFYVPGLDLCSMDKPLKVAMFIVLWITYGLTVFITWKTRNIKSSFNEVREMCFTCIVILASMTTNTAMQFAHPRYPLSRRFRVVSTLFDSVCVNVVWWGIMAKPIFNCLFRRQKYLREWTAKLYDDGLQKEYKMTNYKNQYQPREIHPLEPFSQSPDDMYHDTDIHSTSRLTFR